jgi:hypothetical protein
VTRITAHMASMYTTDMRLQVYSPTRGAATGYEVDDAMAVDLLTRPYTVQDASRRVLRDVMETVHGVPYWTW